MTYQKLEVLSEVVARSMLTINHILEECEADDDLQFDEEMPLEFANEAGLAIVDLYRAVNDFTL